MDDEGHAPSKRARIKQGGAVDRLDMDAAVRLKQIDLLGTRAVFVRFGLVVWRRVDHLAF